MSGINPFGFGVNNPNLPPQRENPGFVSGEQPGKGDLPPDLNLKDPEAVMNYLNNYGAMNISQMNVDPQMTSRIEGFMGNFEESVGGFLTALEQEFGSTFTEEEMFMLAAGMAEKFDTEV